MNIWNQVKLMGRFGVASMCVAGANLAMIGTAHAANVDVQVSSFVDSPDPAIRGGQVAYTTVIKNGGPAIATNVVVTWPIPSNTTFVSVSDGVGGGTCVHNGATPGSVTCTYAQVPVDITSADWKTVTLLIQTGALTPNTIASSATATQTDNTDTAPSNNSLAQNTTINNGANLSFAISGAPNPAVGAGNVTWAITGSNLGPDTSGPITVTVPLPGTVTYVSGTGTGWTCLGTTTISCTRAALASGSSYPSLSIVTKISSQVSSGTLTVGGSIGQTTVGDPVSANDSATASVSVNPGLDLGITQDVPTPASTNAGGTAMTFVLRPSNLGPYDATTGANVTFPLPAGFTLTSATGTSGWTCTSAGSPITVTCNLGSSLASGAGSVLTIVTGTPITVNASTQYTLTGTVAVNSGGQTDPIAGNNTAARTVTVTPVGLDLGVIKTKTPSIVAQNANITSTITVTNAAGGVAAASGTIVVTDVLDTTFETYVSASGTNWSCNAATVSTTQTVTCTYNSALASGVAPSLLTIITKAMVNGTATNNATVAYSGTPGDYNISNNGPVPKSVTVTALPNSPDLVAGLSLTTLGGVATTLEYSETIVNYVATLTNANTTSADATDTRMTLTVPAVISGSSSLGAIGIVVTNTSGASSATYTCSPAAGTLSTSTITCNQAAGTVLKPGDLVTFTVPVSRPLTAGTFINPPNVSVTSTTQGDPTPANNTASATVTIDPIADIELVTKSVTSANPALAGTNVTYVLTIKNNGPSSASAVSVADAFTVPAGDAGFTFISAAASNAGTCAGLTANAVYGPGTPTLTCNWAAVVANGNTRTVTVVVRPNWMPGTTVRTIDNTATVSTTTKENTAGTDNGNNSKTATLTINPAAVDALINNTDLVDPLGYDPTATAIGTASTNNDITYDVTLTNNGPSIVSGLGFVYTMTPPVGKTVIFRGDGNASTVASTTTSGTIAGSICDNVGSSVAGPATLTLTCAFATPGQLASGVAAVHRYLVFRVGSPPASGGDTYTTNSTVVTNETDNNGTNNSEGETTTVRQRVDLTIAKVPSANPVQLRQPFNWTITLTNTGPGNSDTTTLTDTLPIGMEFFGALPSFATTGVVKTGTCGVSGQVMTCNISTGSANPLNVGEVAIVTVPVRVTAYPSGGTTSNCASATTDQVDPAVGNNTTVCGALAVQRSSIAGRVFNDPNGDGLFSYTTGAAGSDTGMNVNNIVMLSGTDAYGNAVSLTQSTVGSAASAGAYLFNDLSPADATGYTVTEAQPATHVNGPVDPPAPTLSGTPSAGDQGAYARGGLSGNSSYSTIKLASNQAGTNYNFPEVRRPTLSGRVYVDVNVNNSYTSGTDTNISGAMIMLRNAADLTNSIGTTTTAADGTYSFANVDPLIIYVLEEPLPTTPAGLANRATAVNVGTVNTVATGTAAANSPSAGIDRISGINLSQGLDGINYNFGEDQTTGISGVVFNDRDRNGSKSVTEPGLQGVSLTLVQGATCPGTTFTSPSLTNPASTDSTGAYSFAPVPSGYQYTICETQPAGYANGPVGPATNIIIASLPISGSTGNNFPEVLGSLAGTVFSDYGSGTVGNNNNGIKNTGEAGIGSAAIGAGVAITLTGTTNAGPTAPATVNLTTYTDASGNYSFADLFPGTYVVTETQPSAYVNATAAPPAPTLSGTPVAGDQGTYAQGGISGNSAYSGINLSASQVGTNYNFPEVRRPSLSGTVYVDVNADNVFNAGDTKIVGATVNLRDAAVLGTVVASSVTDSNGTYGFSNLDPFITYVLEEPLPTTPAGLANRAAAVNVGTVNTVATGTAAANSPSAGIDRITGIDLSLGLDGINYNFGEDQTTSISGVVFNDRDRNGSKSVTELGLQGVSLTLVQGATCPGTTFTSPSLINPASTDSTGAYSFAPVPSSYQYTVCETQPAGYADGPVGSATSITIASLPIVGSTGNNFPEVLGSISGKVFADFGSTNAANNNNGTQDPSEPGIGSGTPNLGVPVTLTGSPTAGPSAVAVSLTTSTDASGNFTFEDLFPGSYTITQTAIPSALGVYNDGINTAGTVTSPGAPGTAGAVGANTVSALVLAAGSQSLANNFAKMPVTAITGTVYVDLNRNNNKDAEPADGRLGGVVVTLYRGVTCVGTPVASTSTGTDGTYIFSAISAGLTYAICQTQPPGYGDASVNPGTGATSAAANLITIATLAASGSINNDFGETVGSIAGAVYQDYGTANRANKDNGLKDAGEAGIANVPVTLSGADATGATVSMTLNTDAGGIFVFNNLLAPNATGYTLVEGTIPAASGIYVDGKDTAGDAAVASGNATAINDQISGIRIAPGQNASGYIFGELPGLAAISGVVFNDRNRNGIQDAAEPEIGSVTLKLVAGSDCSAAAFSYVGATNPVTTASTSGAFSFTSVPSDAQYTICETQPPGYADSSGSATTSSIAIANLPLSGLSHQNFPEMLGSITGKVFADYGSGTQGNNNNGTQDSSEPGIGSAAANAGVPVTLTGTPTAGPSLAAVSLTTYTDAAGNYSFEDLFPGSYNLAEGLIPLALGTFNDGINTAGPVTPGGTAGIAGAIGVNTIGNIILAAGSKGIGNNFAKLPVTGISGVVYLDINENNQMDATPIDDRIGGTRLTLYAGSTCSGSALGSTTSTAISGTYSFVNLSAGLNYTVCETQPGGFEEGAVNPGTNAALTAATPNAITISSLPAAGSDNNNFGERVGIDLRVSKTHTPATFTTENIGTYTLRVRNVGLQASSGAYTVTDNLPPGMTLAAVPVGTGWICTGAPGATALACTSSTSVGAGLTRTDGILVRVNVPAAVAAMAQPVYNVVYVEGGGEPDQKKPTLAEKSGPPAGLTDCDSSITQNICRDPTTVILSSSLSGTVWYDVGTQSRVLDGGDRRLPGWTVEVLDAANTVIGRAVTGANGSYLVDKLPAKVALTVRFREPTSNVIWGYPVNGEHVLSSPAPCDAMAAIASGSASSCVVLAPSSQLSVVLQPGVNLVEQSLPVDPSGVVYDAVTRLPVPGSVVTLAPNGVCAGWNPTTAIVGAGAGGYTTNGAAISMTVGVDGFYQYLFAPDAGAPASCSFALTVTPPPTHRFVSGIIAPEPGALSPPGSPATVYLVQPQAVAPNAGVGVGTRYFLNITAGNSVAGIIHNHIALDPSIASKLVLTKTGDKRMAELGDTVVYTLSVRNVAGEALPQVTLRDRLPAGFTLIKGTAKAQMNGGTWTPVADPAGHLGPVLGFNLGVLGVNATISVQYRARVGVGAMQGTGINTAKAHGCGASAGCLDPSTLQALVGTVDSNEGQHKVVVTGGVFTDDACVLGKVFVDCNNNHIQDSEELGIPGVRLYFESGQFMVTDSEGKYSICGLTPRSHVLTPDPSTLPRGSVLTTTSNRNLGDANSLFIDLKNGELQRGDFAEGSCSNHVLEQVKARRSQGEVRSVESEKPLGPALRFQSKPMNSPQQGTDSANQPLVQPRQGASDVR